MTATTNAWISDEDVDLSILDCDSDDDRPLVRHNQSSKFRLQSGRDEDFERFLRDNVLRSAAKAKHQNFVSSATANIEAIERSIESVREQNRLDEIETQRVQTYGITETSEFVFVSGRKPRCHPNLENATLRQLLSAEQESDVTVSLSDRLMQPMASNSLCRSCPRDELFAFFMHLIIVHQDTLIVHRAQLLVSALISGTQNEPGPISLLDPDLISPRIVGPIISVFDFVTVITEGLESNGARDVSTTATTSALPAACPPIPMNVAALLSVCACYFGSLSSENAVAIPAVFKLLATLLAILIDPRAIEVAVNIKCCLRTIFHYLSCFESDQNRIVTNIASMITQERQITESLLSRFRILADLPMTPFGSQVTQRGAVSLLCSEMLIDVSPIDDVAVDLGRVFNSPQGTTLSHPQRSTLIQLQQLTLFRHIVAPLVVDIAINSWKLMLEHLPEDHLNTGVSTCRELLQNGLRIAQLVRRRSPSDCLGRIFPGTAADAQLIGIHSKGA